MITMTREVLWGCIEDLALDLHIQSEETGELGWRALDGDDILTILEHIYGKVRDLVNPAEALAAFERAIEYNDWIAIQQELAQNGDFAAAQTRARRRLEAEQKAPALPGDR